MVGARDGLYEGATDGRFVDGICEGPVGDTEGTKGCLEVVGRLWDRKKVLLLAGIC